MSKPNSKDIIANISPARRDFVRKAVSVGFALPAVATFSMSGLLARPASAQSNMS